jgi:hypothetical protein
MLLSVWVGLAVSVVTVAAGAGFAGLRALRGWRAFRAASAAISDGLAALAASAAATAERATEAVGRSDDVLAASARLERSLAELAVLRRAADRVSVSARLVRAVVPRK